MSEDRRSGEDRRAVNNETVEKIDKIYTILVGNGKMGLCGKVEILWYSGLFLITGVCIFVGGWMWEQLLK